MQTLLNIKPWYLIPMLLFFLVAPWLLWRMIYPAIVSFVANALMVFFVIGSRIQIDTFHAGQKIPHSAQLWWSLALPVTISVLYFVGVILLRFRADDHKEKSKKRRKKQQQQHATPARSVTFDKPKGK